MPFDPAVIRASFAVVERRADHMAKYFYAHLFARNPGVRAFFPARMTEQRDRFFSALTQIVLRMENPEQLTGYLRALGRDHRKFQAAPEHYPAVGASLIAALRHFSGHSWTPEIEKAWTEAYTVIARTMTGAAAGVRPEVPAWWEAEVATRRRAAADIVVLTLMPMRPYPFVPGQYLTLSSPRVPKVWRPYSIANAPRSDGTLDVHVRRVPGGLLSTALVDDAAPGELLRLGPPLGDAVLDPHSRRPLLAVAAGTGWGQTRALLEQLAAGPADRDVTVVLAARSQAEQYDLPAVERLLARCARLRVLPTAPARGEGRDDADADAPVRDALARYGHWSGWDVHLSGPPGLAPSLTALLTELGADPALIRHDPAPVTFNRARPLTSSEWFLDQRDVPWINRTDLG
ncbi:globin domain-containing protein [Streptomyces sp. BE20]|uniref:globin domain-containing protein n=1 Tax=Streptomyces sp. BE20 TaxID=3002525 RepID=UPI002E77B2A8|nr:globin domain-containing protein [Streptomyces sp. BE20]MEE1828428.1 globin domain-containing protein [Streptomyces sp. BE20]